MFVGVSLCTPFLGLVYLLAFTLPGVQFQGVTTPIVFVTDDVKEDWWLLPTQSHNPLRPHPELMQEMYSKTGVLFYMYEGYKFVEQAQTFLHLESQQAIIDGIKAVGQLSSQKVQDVQAVFEMFEATKIHDMLAVTERLESMNIPDLRALWEQVKAMDIEDKQALVEPIEATNMSAMQALQVIFEQLGVLKVTDMRAVLQTMEALNLPDMKAMFEALNRPDIRAAFEHLDLPDIQPTIEAFTTPTMQAALKTINFPDIRTVLEAALILSKLYPPAQVIEASNQSEVHNSEVDNETS